MPASRVLLVEGADDKHVVRQLCGRHPDMPPFCVLDKQGFPKLKDAISPEIKVSGRAALGILVDANDDPIGRWQAIVDRLRSTGVELPAQMDSAGTIVENGNGLRVGIWLMPDNGSAGEIEDFIVRLMPAGDPVWPRARRYIDSIPAGERKFAGQKVLRARIHAWLAARAEPRKMGAAIGAGDLDATAPLATQLTDWLRRLFG